MSASRAARIAGCLLGGALGDALGQRYEGGTGHVDSIRPELWEISDDTQLTLATCESLIAERAILPEAIAAQFLRWYRARRLRGLGASTLHALRELNVGGHWALVGATGERAAGNGAAMRVALLAFFLDPYASAGAQLARDVCWITHRHDEAYLGALAILRSIHWVETRALDRSLLAGIAETLPDSRLRDRLHEATRCTLQDYVERFGVSGYVVDSVPLAMLAVSNADDFRDAIQELVQYGGDADTHAALFGQMWGAAYGKDALPDDWIARLDSSALIREIAVQLAELPDRLSGPS